MSRNVPIPLYFQQLFDRSLRNGDSSRVSHYPTTLFTGKVRNCALNEIQHSVERKDTQEDPIQRIQDETAQFLIPHHGLTYPVEFIEEEKLTRQKIEEKGEFWTKKLGPNIQRGINVQWEKVQKIDHSFIIDRTLQLLQWIRHQLDPTPSPWKSSIRREAGSLITEIFEFLFIIGSELDLIHLQSDGIGPTTVIDSITMNKPGNEGINGKITWMPKEPSDIQKTFTSELLLTIQILVHQVSKKELYVMFIGIIQNDKIKLNGKLICLEFFADVLKTFTAKRAAHLMSANSIIYAVLFKNGTILEEAERSYNEILDNENNVVMQDSKLPFYIEWLTGVSRYIYRYFLMLGEAATVKQADDFHGVGPNSCASLLSKVILVLGTTFRSEAIGEDYQYIGDLIWSPLSVFDTSRLPEIVTYYFPSMLRCLSEFLWLYSDIQSALFLEEIESVNILGPLDDGSGDLEITPVTTAFISSLITMHSRQLLGNLEKEKRVILPLVLSPQRYTSIGLSGSFVLLRGSQFLARESPGTPAANCLAIGSDQSVFFHLRRQRIADFGLNFFRWSCLAAGCLKSLPQETFETLHGFTLRPTHLIAIVLFTLAHYPVQPSKKLCRFILNECIVYWVLKYPISTRLFLLQCIPATILSLLSVEPSSMDYGNTVTLTKKRQPVNITAMEEKFELADIEPQLLTSIMQIYKNVVIKGLSQSSRENIEQECAIYAMELLKMSKIMFSRSVRPVDQGDAILTFLTLLESILLNEAWCQLHLQLSKSEMLKSLLSGFAEQIDIEREVCKSRTEHASIGLLGFTFSRVRQLLEKN